MIAKIAYLTTPAPGRFVLNFQAFGCDGIQSIEISKEHLANVVIDGALMMLKPNNLSRISETRTKEETHERTADHRA